MSGLVPPFMAISSGLMLIMWSGDLMSPQDASLLGHHIWCVAPGSSWCPNDLVSCIIAVHCNYFLFLAFTNLTKFKNDAIHKTLLIKLKQNKQKCNLVIKTKYIFLLTLKTMQFSFLDEPYKCVFKDMNQGGPNLYGVHMITPRPIVSESWIIPMGFAITLAFAMGLSWLLVDCRYSICN